MWSLIDTGNLKQFPALPGLETVTVAIDNDPNGAGQTAAEECIERLLDAGIEVCSAQTNRVKDFNDVLQRTAI